MSQGSKKVQRRQTRSIKTPTKHAEISLAGTDFQVSGKPYMICSKDHNFNSSLNPAKSSLPNSIEANGQKIVSEEMAKIEDYEKRLRSIEQARVNGDAKGKKKKFNTIFSNFAKTSQAKKVENRTEVL